MVLTDHNFPAVLPTASGNCLAIMRIEHGDMKDLYDLLVSIAPENFPFLENLFVWLSDSAARGRTAGVFKRCH